MGKEDALRAVMCGWLLQFSLCEDCILKMSITVLFWSSITELLSYIYISIHVTPNAVFISK